MYDVDRMLAGMSSSLLTEWETYDHMEPIDLRWRMDFAAAGIASVTANVHRNQKKKNSPFVRGDFMPKYQRERRKPKDLYSELRTWAMMTRVRK